MASPFFILGSGRCGSTLLYWILREHPEIALTNEARVLEHLYFCLELANIDSDRRATFTTQEEVTMRGIVSQPYAATYAKVFERHASQVCTAFYQEFFADRAFRWWGDKLPDLRAAMSARWVWPDSRFVVLVRDPRDVLCSWRTYAERDAIADKHPYLVEMPAAEFAQVWLRYYTAVAEHFDNPLVVQYVDLCTTTRTQVERVLHFLGLSWVDALDHAMPAVTADLSHRTTTTVDASIGRWRTELSADDARTVLDACGATMAHFGLDAS